MRGAENILRLRRPRKSLSLAPTRGGSRLLAAIVVFSAVALVAGCGGNAVGMLSGAALVAGDGNETLSGAARVIDADTIEVGGEVAGERVRLMGIDAPERGQHCRDGAARSYPCGAEATAALRCRIGGADVRCEASGRDGYGRAIAVCFAADGVDLNGWLVREGHALAYRHFSPAYVGDEEAARRARRGVWEGTFVPPWRWRKGERLPERDCRCAPDDGGSVSAPSPSRDDAPPLELWDDNGNGRISCSEARRHGIAPVPRGHPAYPFMRDGDGDGVVCE